MQPATNEEVEPSYKSKWGTEPKIERKTPFNSALKQDVQPERQEEKPASKQEAAADLKAVSYTHLDVYKRQSMSWIVFVVALLLALGVLAEISAWIVGPSRALLDTAHDGILPPTFKKVNKNGVSVKTVVIQACIVTVWDLSLIHICRALAFCPRAIGWCL